MNNYKSLNRLLTVVILALSVLLVGCEEEDLTPTNQTYNEPEEVIGFRIVQVYVQNFPYCALGGGAWDGEYPNDHPDLKISLGVPGTNLSYSGAQFYDNPHANWTGLDWEVYDIDQFVTLSVVDLDNLGVVSTEQQLLLVNFNGQSLIDDPDDTYSVLLSANSSCWPYGQAQSWLRIRFELIYG